MLFWAYIMKVILSVPNECYFERTYWRLFPKRTKFDIYVLLLIVFEFRFEVGRICADVCPLSVYFCLLFRCPDTKIGYLYARIPCYYLILPYIKINRLLPELILKITVIFYDCLSSNVTQRNVIWNILYLTRMADIPIVNVD